MLVLDDSPYGMHVPVYVGSIHIDMAIELATESKMQKLNHKWECTKIASLLHMGSLTVEGNKPEFDLGEVKGSVHLTQNLTLGPFENVTISGQLIGPVKQSS